MLFHVQMDVRLPHDMPPDKADALKKAERERAQELQQLGKCIFGELPGAIRTSAFST